MEKLNSKTEEIILVILALLVLSFSMFNPTVSVILAISGLIIVLLYNYLTRKK
jgi:4-hydroxybenzoate polyprenyltransferase